MLLDRKSAEHTDVKERHNTAATSRDSRSKTENIRDESVSFVSQFACESKNKSLQSKSTEPQHILTVSDLLIKSFLGSV
ncbi:uncharacterized [Tachysurus ichikawai]